MWSLRKFVLFGQPGMPVRENLKRWSDLFFIAVALAMTQSVAASSARIRMHDDGPSRARPRVETQTFPC